MHEAIGEDGIEKKCQHNCEDFAFEPSLSAVVYPNENPFIRRRDFCYIFKVRNTFKIGSISKKVSKILFNFNIYI